MRDRGSLNAAEAQLAKDAPLLPRWVDAATLLGPAKTAMLLHSVCRQLPNVRMMVEAMDENGEKFGDTFTGDDEVGYPLTALGDKAIPCLLSQITNSTWTPDPRMEPLIGSMTVGDVAYWSLMVLGVDWDIAYRMLDRKRFDEVGVGAYFEWIDQPGNRKRLQTAVARWVKEHPQCCASRERFERDDRVAPEFVLSPGRLATLRQKLAEIHPGMSEQSVLEKLGKPDPIAEAQSPDFDILRDGERRAATYFVESWSGNKQKRDLLRDHYVTLVFTEHGRFLRMFSNVEGIPPMYPKTAHDWQHWTWE